MGFWDAVVLVALICGVVTITLVRYGAIGGGRNKHLRPENDRLHQEVSTLRKRLEVLERIATENDRGVSLDREIEQLRHAPIN